MLKSKTKKIMAAAAGMLLLCSVAAAETAGLQTVTKAGSNATVQANPKNFTGTEPGPPVCSVPTALRKLTLQ